MDAVLRAASVYLFLWLIFRAFGKRALAQITTFDFVMLLILAETTQQALLGDDFSVTNAFILISSLLIIDRILGFIKERSPRFDAFAEGKPVVLVNHGRLIDEAVTCSGVDLPDILAAAREMQGLERLDQIKYAILERSGDITVVPAK